MLNRESIIYTLCAKREEKRSEKRENKYYLGRITNILVSPYETAN